MNENLRRLRDGADDIVDWATKKYQTFVTGWRTRLGASDVSRTIALKNTVHTFSSPEVRTLGSFSPIQLVIRLPGPPSEIRHLSDEQKRIYAHELGHVVHYFATDLGLRDLRSWLEIVDVLVAPAYSGTPEDTVTWQAEQVLSCERGRQALSLDDNYYFEQRDDLIVKAESDSDWSWSEGYGHLFDASGQITEIPFWFLRFSLRSSGESFIRIPFGRRVAMEHAAKGVDWLQDWSAGADADRVLDKYQSEASSPHLLHYYALSQRVATELQRSGARIEEIVLLPYQIAAVLAFTISIIPYHREDVWERLRQWAVAHGMFDGKAELLLARPHVSFVFPILLNAFFETADPVSNADPERTLKAIRLPSLSDLVSTAQTTASEVARDASKHELTERVAEVIAQVSQGIRGKRLSDVVLNPTSVLQQPPIPILFDGDNETFLPGSVIQDLNYAEEMNHLYGRHQEMLSYPYTRNIARLTQ